MLFKIVFVLIVIIVNILFLLLTNKFKKKKKKFWWPHDFLYEQYIKLCDEKKVRKVNRQKYRQAISLYMKDERIIFIYKIRNLSSEDIKKLAEEYNITQTFIENRILAIVVVPWYNYDKKSFTLAPWK